MRKCNQNYNAKRGGFPIVKGVTVRAAHAVAQAVGNKGIAMMMNSLLTGLLSRVTWQTYTGFPLYRHNGQRKLACIGDTGGVFA